MLPQRKYDILDFAQFGAILLRILRIRNHYSSADNISLPLNLNGPPVTIVEYATTNTIILVAQFWNPAI